MIPERQRHLQQHALARYVGLVGILGQDLVFRIDAALQVLRAVAHVELAVVLELRMKGEAHEPLFKLPIFGLHADHRQVQEDLRLGAGFILRQDDHLATLLHEKMPTTAIRRDHDRDWALHRHIGPRRREGDTVLSQGREGNKSKEQGGAHNE